MHRIKKPIHILILTITLVVLSAGRTFGRCPIRNSASGRKCDCQRLESKRIIGGKQARLHEYPFQAHLATRYRNGRGETCGGTLISSQWILTAAHCVTEKKFPRPSSIVIRLGEHVTTKADETIATRVFFTNKIIVHEGYRFDPIRNDIALVYLPKPVKFSDAISPACLPFDRVARKEFRGEAMTAVGWGRMNKYNHKNSDTLKKVDLKVFSGGRCVSNFRWNQKYVTKDMICGYNEGQNVCDGDSGGPLIYNENGHTYVVGVASFVGDKTCVENPAVFVRVASYLDWIRAKTEEKFCSI